MVEQSAARTTCVTGASGYIGSHVVRELLERGHTVHATVRDKDDDSKTGHLLRLAEGKPGKLVLFSADLMVSGSFDEAMSGCDSVCHIASVVKMSAADPEAEIVRPAISGTRNVVESIARTGSIRDLVQTSSVAAIHNLDQPSGTNYTEADWNEYSSVKTDPYGFAKVSAERLAWDFAQSRDDLRMVAINPVVVFGPLYAQAHAKSSGTIIRDLLKGRYPACPNLYFSVVDVRDVARAHVEALLRPEARGRYILSHSGLWLIDLARQLAEIYPQHKFPRRKLPNIVMYLTVPFDKRLSVAFLRNNLSKYSDFDGSKVTRELGIQLTPLADTLRDCCESFEELGIVKIAR